MVILRGNDITLRWTITKCLDGSEVPEDFSDADLSVFILSFYDRVRVNALVDGNVLIVSIPGNTQKTGAIGIEAVWSKNSGKNWSRAKEVNVLKITDDPSKVTHCCSKADVDIHTLPIKTSIFGALGRDGATPEIINGNWWIGLVDTGVSATGPRGDAFTFEDFTPEQIDMLKHPAVDASKEVKKLESAISLNEQGRIQAEQNRTQAEQDRSLAEQERTDNESTRVANEKSRRQAEAVRGKAESNRSSAELLRAQGEENRITEEQNRVIADQSREMAEQGRVTASDEAVGKCEVAATHATDQGDYAKEQGDAAKTAAGQAVNAKMALFIDLWNARCNQLRNCGTYNVATKLFELNGILDIGYDEATRIWAASAFTTAGNNFSAKFYNIQGCRTLFPIECDRSSAGMSAYFDDSFSYSSPIRINVGTVMATSIRGIFYGSKVQEVWGAVHVHLSGLSGLNGAEHLVKIRILWLKASGNINQNKSLSNESILEMVTQAANTSQITITLHPDVYARATADEAIVAKALEKNIILTGS